MGIVITVHVEDIELKFKCKKVFLLSNELRRMCDSQKTFFFSSIQASLEYLCGQKRITFIFSPVVDNGAAQSQKLKRFCRLSTKIYSEVKKNQNRRQKGVDNLLINRAFIRTIFPHKKEIKTVFYDPSLLYD